MERYGAGTIEVCDYDPAWPEMFVRERTALQAALGSTAIAVEHVGSTAVPGLAAKPIIDVLVGVKDLDKSRTRCMEQLQAVGYRYMAEYESWLPGELLFRKGVHGPWTHHVHVTEPSSLRWEEFIPIRDYLRAHPDSARAYADLKRSLARVFNGDIAGYRVAKADCKL